MKSIISSCDNEKGFAIVIVISVLALITLVGIMATRTTSTELQIATSDEIYKISFYAAEASRAYVYNNNDLYGAANIDPENAIGFSFGVGHTVMVFMLNCPPPVSTLISGPTATSV